MKFPSGFFIILILSASSLLAQQPKEKLTAIPARPEQPDVPQKIKKAATSLSLPFLDDFSYDSNRPAQELWTDDHVYINQTFAPSPPTLGVATFDGLNRYGLAYQIGNLRQDTGDMLTSQPIDLSATTDSVYLSFLWQAGGLGEHPETGDSLTVQFFDPDSLEWKYAWSMSGVDSTGFRNAMIPVTDSVYLKDGFQFRFVAYGNQAGGFDIWNIDYVHLDEERNFDDTLFTDIAFTRPHPSLLNNYEAIPWFHAHPMVVNPLLKDEARLYYQRNLRPDDTYNPFLGVYQISMDGQVLDEDMNGSLNLDTDRPNNTESTYKYAFDISLSSVPDDEFTIDLFTTYNQAGPVSSRSANDTLKHQQVFSNYYAYDDGTAERAYHVEDNNGGFILSRYEIYADNDDVDDVVKGLYIYFFPAEYDATASQFSIVIYDEDDNGLPGDLLYESDSIYTPEYSATNFYLPYKMDNGGFQVHGNVFIGIRQQSIRNLPIGFDRNNVGRTEVFYGNTGPNLYQSFFKGTLMMRPYLSYDPADIGLPEVPAREQINLGVYPNPAIDKVFIDLDEREDQNLVYSLTDLGGRLLQSGKLSAQIEFHQKISKGIYLLKIEDPSGNRNPLVTKLFINP